MLLCMNSSGMVHGLAFWFDVAFIGSGATVWLSTAPTEALTHWYQVRCLLQNPVLVKQVSPAKEHFNWTVIRNEFRRVLNFRDKS